MGTITNFECMQCKETDPRKAHVYDGLMGYEAIICKSCGTYTDYNGKHDPDEFSKDYVTNPDNYSTSVTIPKATASELKRLQATEHENSFKILDVREVANGTREILYSVDIRTNYTGAQLYALGRYIAATAKLKEDQL